MRIENIIDKILSQNLFRIFVRIKTFLAFLFKIHFILKTRFHN